MGCTGIFMRHKTKSILFALCSVKIRVRISGYEIGKAVVS